MGIRLSRQRYRRISKKNTVNDSSFHHEHSCDSNEVDTNGEEEQDLVQQLKITCDESGRERDPAKSAKIFYKLAHVFKQRSPSLVFLIKSIVLFNAALIRCSRSNAELIMEDLKKSCEHVLYKAAACNQSADLIRKSKEVKQLVNEMRKKVFEQLKRVDRIPDDASKEERERLEHVKIFDIQTIQRTLTQDYVNIMADIAQYCEEVMGPPPCKYALLGMGSIARKEITPYSDFEHIIVLENGLQKSKENNILNYFRWFSVVFHTVIANLQETIIPCLNIPNLNDKMSLLGDWFYDGVTTRGISFDGMMPHACKYPLGRQQFTKDKPWKTELIKPVDEMLQYLSSEENLKNGYHLGDILTKTCFVSGEYMLFDMFETSVKGVLSRQRREEVIKEQEIQITDDLRNFATRSTLFKMKLNKTFNIKRAVYRSTTLFVAALGRIYGISASSCDAIILGLAEEKHITSSAMHKLRFAISLACEMRLRWYMRNESQQDEIRCRTEKQNTNKLFLNLVGKASTISYFQIAYALQCDIAKRLNLKKSYFFAHPEMLNLSIYFCFENKNTLKSLSHIHYTANDFEEKLMGFDECLKRLEKSVVEPTRQRPLKDRLFQRSSSEHQLQIATNFGIFADKLYHVQSYHDAVEYYQISTEILEKITKLNKPKRDRLLISNAYQKIADNYCYSAICFFQLDDIHRAISCAQTSLEIRKEFSKDVEWDRNIAESSLTLGSLLSQVNKFDQSLAYLQKSLKIFEHIAVDRSMDEDVARSLVEIGRCLVNTKIYEGAMSYLEKSWDIQQQIFPDVETVELCCQTLQLIGRCMLNTNRLIGALAQFELSLHIAKNLSMNLSTDNTISEILLDMGSCLTYLNRSVEAEQLMMSSLDIAEKRTADIDTSRNVATVLLKIAKCLFYMKRYTDVFSYVNRSMAIFRRLKHLTPNDDYVNESITYLQKLKHDNHNQH